MSKNECTEKVLKGMNLEGRIECNVGNLGMRSNKLWRFSVNPPSSEARAKSAEGGLLSEANTPPLSFRTNFSKVNKI